MRSWLIPAIAPPVLAAAAAVACSSFSSSGEATPAGPDAATTADAQLDDAADAQLDDADTGHDAVAPDAGGCAAAMGTLVCADFPDPNATLPTGGFGGLAGTPTSALAIEADPAGSSNYALHARGDAFDGGLGQVFLYKDLVVAPKTLTFSGHVRADGKGVANYIEYFSIVTMAPSDVEVVVADSAGALVVADSFAGDGGAAVTDCTIGPSDAVGTSFEVQLWFDATGTSIEVRKEGVVSLAKRPLAIAGGQVLTGRKLRFGAGVYYATPPTTGGGAFLDDIRLSVTP